jgi:hypothetical protein
MSTFLSEIKHRVWSRKKVRSEVKGYCFCHAQDAARAVDGGGLRIAFGDLDDNKVKKVEVGNLVRKILENKGSKLIGAATARQDWGFRNSIGSGDPLHKKFNWRPVTPI